MWETIKSLSVLKNYEKMGVLFFRGKSVSSNTLSYAHSSYSKIVLCVSAWYRRCIPVGGAAGGGPSTLAKQPKRLVAFL